MSNTLIFLSAIIFFGCMNSTQSRDSHNTTMAHNAQDSPQYASSQATLPDNATAFIQQHFETAKVQRVETKKSPRANGTFYEATLTDDTEIDFGENGNWIEVTAEEPNQLPTSFFPEAIRNYLASSYSGVGVESIDKNARGYELELVNDINIYFDAKGAFIRQEK